MKENLKKERLYLNGFELWQESTSGTVQTERETVRITDGEKSFLQLETLTIDSGSAISTPTTNWRYQYDNFVGSACLETDASANVISYEEYHPFGTSSYRSGSSAAEVKLRNYRYVGKERDEETGLYNYGLRSYSAWLCRFVSVDPLKDNYPFQNSYAYAANNPITLTDVNGEGPGGGEDEDPPPIDSDLKGSPEYEKEKKGVKHIVKEGDTLSDLAEKYELTIDILRDLNPQTQNRKLEDQINTGEELNIPDSKKPIRLYYFSFRYYNIIPSDIL